MWLTSSRTDPTTTGAALTGTVGRYSARSGQVGGSDGALQSVNWLTGKETDMTNRRGGPFLLPFFLSLVLAGCGGSPLNPSSTMGDGVASAGLGTDGSNPLSAAVGQRTRVVLNQDKKVVGIRFLDVGGVLFDVTFSNGGLSYDEALASLRRVTSRRMTSFTSSTEAIAAVNAIRIFFNTSVPPITAADAGWDSLFDNNGRGDVVVPYVVSSTVAPYAYTGWDATLQTWVFSGTFAFERDRQLTSAATWAFFTQ